MGAFAVVEHFFALFVFSAPATDYFKVDEQEAYKELKHKKGDFPVSEALSQDILSLPMFPHMTQEQIEYVCKTLKELVAVK